LQVVAFTDPNDLLSYRLQSFDGVPGQPVQLVNVLVSNAPTYFGYLANPALHGDYGSNPNVAKLLLYGSDRR
jgi:hypothetical protein